MLLKLQSFKWLRGHTFVYEYFTRSDIDYLIIYNIIYIKELNRI